MKRLTLALVVAALLGSITPLGAPPVATGQQNCTSSTITQNKTASPDPVAPGGNLTYTLTLTTTGTCLQSVVLTDVLPQIVGANTSAATTFVSVTPAANFNCQFQPAGSSGQGTLGCVSTTQPPAPVPAGTYTFTLVVNVPAVGTGGVSTAGATITNSMTIITTCVGPCAMGGNPRVTTTISGAAAATPTSTGTPLLTSTPTPPVSPSPTGTGTPTPTGTVTTTATPSSTPSPTATPCPPGAVPSTAGLTSDTEGTARLLSVEDSAPGDQTRPSVCRRRGLTREQKNELEAEAAQYRREANDLLAGFGLGALLPAAGLVGARLAETAGLNPAVAAIRSAIATQNAAAALLIPNPVSSSYLYSEELAAASWLSPLGLPLAAGLLANAGLAGAAANQLFTAADTLERIAADPPDSNFTVVAQPIVVPSAPVTVDSSVPPAVVDASNALLINLVQQNALLPAFLTSVERAQGAGLAGNSQFETVQLQAAGTYALQLAALFEIQPQLRANLLSALLAANSPPQPFPTEGAPYPLSLTLLERLAGLEGSAQAFRQFAAQQGVFNAPPLPVAPPVLVSAPPPPPPPPPLLPPTSPLPPTVAPGPSPEGSMQVSPGGSPTPVASPTPS